MMAEQNAETARFKSKPNEKTVVVLDGGTGVALIDGMGHDALKDDPLWSAAAVKLYPHDLIKVHKDFYLAGADVVVTATYQASIEGYIKKFDISEEEAVDLIQSSVRLAKTARDEASKATGRKLYVAGSVGPYGATLADMSEYTGNYVDRMSKQELTAWHFPRLKAMVSEGVDLLAIETIPALVEAVAILEAMQSFPDVKVWVTFQCKDGTSLAHGEPIGESVRTVCAFSNVIAVGVNCVHPHHVTSLLDHIREADPQVPIIVKPNNGWEQGISNIAEYGSEWLKHGADWIGGCCHIYASDIEELRNTLAATPGIRLLNNLDKLV